MVNDISVLCVFHIETGYSMVKRTMFRMLTTDDSKVWFVALNK